MKSDYFLAKWPPLALQGKGGVVGANDSGVGDDQADRGCYPARLAFEPYSTPLLLMLDRSSDEMRPHHGTEVFSTSYSRGFARPHFLE